MLWLVPFALLLASCQPAPPSTSAPLGDYAALENLAEAFRQVSLEYPVQPVSMSPEGRKKFVQRVFSAAGYDYSATLSSVAHQGQDVTNQDHRDLVELLLLPHKGLDEIAWDELYSKTELAAVHAIKGNMR